MTRILVIAYGNPLRCDDGLAWRAAEDLSQLDLHFDIEVIARQQLTPELALAASQASAVLFIDATLTGVPGELVCAPLRPQQRSNAFSHDFSPEAILTLAQELYGTCPEAFSISLCGECFDHGEILSPKVLDALPRVAALVRQFAMR
jgi:hydrogenase maturation protease